MKAVFVGGGALRHLSILRGAVEQPGVFDGGHIVLYDLSQPRAEAMARMLMKTPEYARCRCKISWDLPLDKALEGADVVSVVLLGGSRLSYELGHDVSHQHGYISSDNLSPNGALLAVKTAPILIDIAQRMKRLCPRALLLDFANPVAVMSSLINTHFGIQTLGVCAGYTNHQWDLSRLLGKDECSSDFDVNVAGVNHLSYILAGTYRGRDLFEVLRAHTAKSWKPPALGNRWSATTKRYIRLGLLDLVKYLQQLDVLIFSTEGDGMAHLHYETAVRQSKLRAGKQSRAQVAARVKAEARQRAEQDAEFAALLSTDLSPHFWKSRQEDYVFGRDPDIFVKILTAVATNQPAKIVTSRPNAGAVDGFPANTVLEYSQTIRGTTITPAAHLAVPQVVRGITDGLATHQTMLASAIAANDPKMLAQALLAYPVAPYSHALRSLMKSLLRINQKEIPVSLRAASGYL